MTSRKFSLAVVSVFAVAVLGVGLAGAAGVVVQPGQAPGVVQPSPPVTGQSSAPTVVVPQQQTPTTVVVPQQSPSVVVQTPPATLQAGDIVAQEVRAQTIYANKIKSPMVQGSVHQSDTVKIKDTKGDIK